MVALLDMVSRLVCAWLLGCVHACVRVCKSGWVGVQSNKDRENGSTCYDSSVPGKNDGVWGWGAKGL